MGAEVEVRDFRRRMDHPWAQLSMVYEPLSLVVKDEGVMKCNGACDRTGDGGEVGDILMSGANMFTFATLP